MLWAGHIPNAEPHSPDPPALWKSPAPDPGGLQCLVAAAPSWAQSYRNYERDGAFRLHLRRQVTERELRRKLTPDYPIGCKRVLFSNDWYPALTRNSFIDRASNR